MCQIAFDDVYAYNNGFGEDVGGINTRRPAPMTATFNCLFMRAPDSLQSLRTKATRPTQLRLPANVGHLDLLPSRRGKLVGLGLGIGTAQLRIAILALSPYVGHDGRKLFV
jgi:hypothetical protein